MDDREDFHSYPHGRFVCDVTLNMAKRYVNFDIHELQKVAAQATNPESCVGVEKLPEGWNSKTFLMTTNDGAQVVTMLPNPCGGRPHFSTATEVAIINYVSQLVLSGRSLLTYQVRNHLGMPVPRMYAYCSRA